MPRNIRPAWLTAEADGIGTPLAIGPKARSGRLEATLTIREEGDIKTAAEIIVQPTSDGSATSILIRVFAPEGEKTHRWTVVQ